MADVSDFRMIRPVTVAPFGGSFTSGGGTYYDKDGTLQTAAPGELRFTYDPADLSQPPRVLVEPAATNLLLNSEGTISSLEVSGQVSNAATSVAGFVNSIQFGDNSATRWAYHTFATVPGTTYTLSVHVKMDDGGPPVIGLNGDSGADLSMVAQSDVFGGASEVRYVGDGVYRACFTFVAN
jgi:hypothetical protein